MVYFGHYWSDKELLKLIDLSKKIQCRLNWKAVNRTRISFYEKIARELTGYKKIAMRK